MDDAWSPHPIDEHGIVADIEMICSDEINAAYERMLQGDVTYRVVIDSAPRAA